MNYRDLLDDKRKNDIEDFKVKHPAQYYCITEQAKEQGTLERQDKILDILKDEIVKQKHLPCISQLQSLRKRIKELELKK